MGGPYPPRLRRTIPGPAVNLRMRLAVTFVGLAVVWGVAFNVGDLPFYPLVLAGGVGSGLAGLWVRRAATPWFEEEPPPPPTYRLTGGDATLAVIAAILHFAVGHLLFWLGSQLLPGLTDTAASVYERSASVAIPVQLLFGALITAPLEEIYWRGAFEPYVRDEVRQRFDLDDRRTRWAGILGHTALYGLFHVATGQLALVAAALLGGLVWGWLVERTKSVGATMLAHGLWTAMMIVVPPVGVSI